MGQKRRAQKKNLTTTTVSYVRKKKRVRAHFDRTEKKRISGSRVIQYVALTGKKKGGNFVRRRKRSGKRGKTGRSPRGIEEKKRDLRMTFEEWVGEKKKGDLN